MSRWTQYIGRLIILTTSQCSLEIHLKNITSTSHLEQITISKKKLNNATRTSIEKRTGVYKMICDDCDMHYIGQTGRGFFERYKEHLPTSISNTNKSNYAKHLVSLNHNYTNFEANCKPLHICKKGRYMYICLLYTSHWSDWQGFFRKI